MLDWKYIEKVWLNIIISNAKNNNSNKPCHRSTILSNAGNRSIVKCVTMLSSLRVSSARYFDAINSRLAQQHEWSTAGVNETSSSLANVPLLSLLVQSLTFAWSTETAFSVNSKSSNETSFTSPKPTPFGFFFFWLNIGCQKTIIFTFIFTHKNI